MSRPKCFRNIEKNSQISYFKPSGIPKNKLENIVLEDDEFEALRLKHIKNLDQNSCANKMNISQSTFHRILLSAHKKISSAIIEGKVISFQKKLN